MKSNRWSRRVKVSADGEGLVSRAGVVLLRELSVDTGLSAGWTDALLDTYKAWPAVHEPGRVLADLAVVIADGVGASGDPAGSGQAVRDGRLGRDGVALRGTRRCGAPAAVAGCAGGGAGTGLGRRRGTRSDRRVDHRHRRDDHHRAQREDQRGEDVYLLTELASGSGVALTGERMVPTYVPRYGRCSWWRA